MTELSRRTVIVAVAGTASLGALTLSRSRGWPGGPSTGTVRTSFGSVTVLGSSRIGTTGTAAHAAHTGHAAADMLVASAVHGAWTAGVAVDLEVHNRLRRPVELSPGQFRVRVGRAGPTVSLYSSDREAEPLPPGASRTLRISYLAPPPDQPLTLLFDDTGSRRPVDLGPVGRPSSTEVAS